MEFSLIHFGIRSRCVGMGNWDLLSHESEVYPCALIDLIREGRIKSSLAVFWLKPSRKLKKKIHESCYLYNKFELNKVYFLFEKMQKQKSIQILRQHRRNLPNLQDFKKLLKELFQNGCYLASICQKRHLDYEMILLYDIQPFLLPVKPYLMESDIRLMLCPVPGFPRSLAGPQLQLFGNFLHQPSSCSGFPFIDFVLLLAHEWDKGGDPLCLSLLHRVLPPCLLQQWMWSKAQKGHSNRWYLETWIFIYCAASANSGSLPYLAILN